MKKNRMQAMGTSVQSIAKKLTEYSKLEKYILLASLKTREKGLDIVDVEMLSDQYKSNEISHEKAKPWYIQLAKAFANPFTAVLLVIAAISFLTEVVLAKPSEKSPAAVIVILLLLLISGGLRFFQEFRSGKEAESLKSMVKTTTTVIRRENGKEKIQMADLLPGDIVVLAGGDMIPADLRILKAKDLFISQSALTGESEPVEKYPEPDKTIGENNLFDLRNICFMGTNVIGLSGCTRHGRRYLFWQYGKNTFRRTDANQFR